MSNIDKETKIAVENAFKAQDKAISDATQNLVKSADDIVDAAHATARYAERQVNSYQEVLSNAERRVREGKVADAIWHISTEGWQETNKNAAQLANENEIIAAAGQAVATAYGGPAGSAAYAAWLTYNKTGGNVELALKAGVYAYAVSSGNLKAGDMPTDTLGGVAKKAAMTGAVGGLAVAASGGSTKESLDAFIKSGGAVVVQEGQSYVKKNYSSVGPSKLDAYCVTAVGRSCAAAEKWYEKSKTRLDELAKAKEVRPTVLMTKNGEWSISWNKSEIVNPQEDVPAVALTYVGEGSSFKNTVGVMATLGDPSKFPNTWVAFRDVGASSSFFSFANPRAGQTAPAVGDQLIANRDINIRAAPAEWKEKRGVLAEGTAVIVLEIKTLTADGKQQQWVRVQSNAIPSSATVTSPSNPSLEELIAAIEQTDDKDQKKDLKWQARKLAAKNFVFPNLTFGETYDYYRFNETLSFVSYDPDSNVLVIRRQRQGDNRPNEETPWHRSESLDAKVSVKLAQLNKLTKHNDGSFDVDCNEGGAKCVTYDVISESCNPSTVECESEMNAYLRFPAGSNLKAVRNLKDAFVTVIYKIDGRPAK
ncbi:hypothetical protein ACU8V1_25875 (plasmid) [Rhizobium leguminosarum]